MLLTGPPLHRAAHSQLVIGSQVITQPNVSPLFAAGVQQRTFLSDVHSTILNKVNGFGASANEKRAARWDGGPVSNIGGTVSGHPYICGIAGMFSEWVTKSFPL